MDAGQTEGEALLRLALSDPARVSSRVASILAGRPGPLDESYARQAAGIVLRDAGRTAAAIRELRRALAAAERSGAPRRVVDVRASLGAALVMHGRAVEGLAELDLAASGARGRARATVLMRRAYVLTLVGRYDEALADLRSALDGIRQSGDAVWEARTLNNRGSLLLRIGLVGLAERDLLRAEQMFTVSGQRLEAAHTLHNRAYLAQLRGDLPEAFARYDRAAVIYADLGIRSADLVVDRCRAYLEAGLPSEAVALAQRALVADPLQPGQRAEVRLVLASAALAVGNASTAARSASLAGRAFDRAGRSLWVARSVLVAAQADHLAGRRPHHLETLRPVVDELVAAKVDEAPVALLLLGRLALAAGQDGHGELRAAARFRHRGTSTTRATGWLALALDRQAVGDRVAVLRACRAGLAALAAQRAILGSTQLRALTARHGDELAAIALRHVVATGSARSLLVWSERGRAAVRVDPALRPPQDPALAAELAAMRAVARTLEDARDRGLPVGELTTRLHRLESAIDHRQRRGRAGDSAASRRHDPGRSVDVATLLAALGDATLVELVEVEGHLHAVVARAGRVRRCAVGPMVSALAAVQRARFALRQAARLRPTDLRSVGRQLEVALLGPAVRMLGDGPVVVVPPARLHDAPYPLCPALSDRPVGTAPSAAWWLRMQAQPQRAPGPTVLIAGPGVPAGAREAQALAGRHPAAVLLVGAEARVARVQAELDGAAIAHVAAHGRHRRDNPMFSALLLADGPLTVHDFEQLRRPPVEVVLSACDTGMLSAVSAAEVLGMATGLLAQGSRAVICAVSEVNDEATLPMMLVVHDALAEGVGPAVALHRARARAHGDTLASATAAAFTALGA